MNVYADASWIWGSQRGYVDINYCVTGNNSDGTKSITGHMESATDGMTWGTSDSEIKVESFSTGPNGHYQVAWGWYLATTGVSLSLTYENGGFTVEGSGLFGSEAHSTGGEYVAPSKLD